MTFSDILLKSFSENFKQLTKMNYFLLFLRFYENRRILSCFHNRYEFCMQKYRSKCIFIEFLYKAKFWLISLKGYSLAIQPSFLNIWKFLILLYLSSFPSKDNILWLFLTFCSRISVIISNNWQKMNDFLLFLHFHENRRILHCFHHRYEFCMQKYPSKCIIIELP